MKGVRQRIRLVRSAVARGISTLEVAFVSATEGEVFRATGEIEPGIDLH